MSESNGVLWETDKPERKWGDHFFRINALGKRKSEIRYNEGRRCILKEIAIFLYFERSSFISSLMGTMIGKHTRSFHARFLAYPSFSFFIIPKL